MVNVERIERNIKSREVKDVVKKMEMKEEERNVWSGGLEKKGKK